MNLLTETKSAIKNSGHDVTDIAFIGSSDGEYRCTWGEFCALADREYDSGFGGQEVASDLIIVFSDGQQMWRGEYDGSEWWEFPKPFSMPASSKPIKNLFCGIGWDDLSALNGGESDN